MHFENVRKSLVLFSFCLLSLFCGEHICTQGTSTGSTSLGGFEIAMMRTKAAPLLRIFSEEINAGSSNLSSASAKYCEIQAVGFRSCKLVTVRLHTHGKAIQLTRLSRQKKEGNKKPETYPDLLHLQDHAFAWRKRSSASPSLPTLGARSAQ